MSQQSQPGGRKIAAGARPPADRPMNDQTEPDLVRPPPPAAPTARDLGGATTPSDLMPVLPAFGDYVLLGEIARGGMGVVYRARQVQLDRVVALKMILAGRLAHAEDVQRFHSEAAAAARLRHPNIVAVHDVGVVDGQHYFTMEFIEGQSLDQR